MNRGFPWFNPQIEVYQFYGKNVHNEVVTILDDEEKFPLSDSGKSKKTQVWPTQKPRNVFRGMLNLNGVLRLRLSYSLDTLNQASFWSKVSPDLSGSQIPGRSRQSTLARDNVFVFVGKYMVLIEEKTNLIEEKYRLVEINNTILLIINALGRQKSFT